MPTLEDLDKEYQKIFGVAPIMKEPVFKEEPRKFLGIPFGKKKVSVSPLEELDKEYQGLFGVAPIEAPAVAGAIPFIEKPKYEPKKEVGIIETLKQLPASMWETVGKPVAESVKETVKKGPEATFWGFWENVAKFGDAIVTAPFKVAKGLGVPLPETVKHPAAIFAKLIGKDEWIDSIRDIEIGPSYAERVQKDIESGMSPTASWLLHGSEALIDLCIAGGMAKGLIEKGVAKIAKPPTEGPKVVDARKMLGISKGATTEQIKSAYRAKAHIFHPDKPGGNAVKFDQLNKAYQTLTGAKPSTVRFRELAYELSKERNWKDLFRVVPEAPPVTELRPALPAPGVVPPTKEIITPPTKITPVVPKAAVAKIVPKPAITLTPIAPKPLVPEVKPIPAEVVKPEVIPKELEPLAQEARKYGSAEEFDKNVKITPTNLGQLRDFVGKRIGELTKQYPDLSYSQRLVTDFYNQATKAVKEVKPEIKPEIKPRIGIDFTKIPLEKRVNFENRLEFLKEKKLEEPYSANLRSYRLRGLSPEDAKWTALAQTEFMAKGMGYKIPFEPLMALEVKPVIPKELGLPKEIKEDKIFKKTTANWATKMVRIAATPQELTTELKELYRAYPKYNDIQKGDAAEEIKSILELLEEIKPTPEVPAPIPKELEALAVEARKYKSATEFIEKGISKRGLYYPENKDLYGLQSREESNVEVWKRALKRKGLVLEKIKYYKNQLKKSEDIVKTTKALRLAGFNTYADFYTQAVKGVKEVKPEVPAKIIKPRIKPKPKLPTKKSPEQLFEETYAKEIEQQLKVFDEEKISKLIGEPEQEIDIASLFLEEEKGFVKIPSFRPLLDIYNRMHDWIFTFGEARRINPELYDQLMQAFGKRNAGIEKAVQEIEKIVGNKIATRDAVKLSLIYENKLTIPPAELKEIYNKFRILFDTIEKKGLEQGIFARTFQERMLEEIEAKIIELKEQLKRPAKSKRIQSLMQDREKIQQMRYLPHNIVAQRAIEAKLKTLEGEERKVFLMKLSRISFRFKMRTGRKFLAEYLEDGLLEPKDIDIRKLAAEALSDYYYRSSLKTLFDWSKAQGLIKPVSDELRGAGWLNAREIGISSPELKTQMVHPMLASAYAEMKAMKIRKGFVGRQILGTVKIAQFIKPQIIWIYDGVQKLMRGTFSLNPIKEAQYLAKSTKEVLTKGEDYHKMNGLNLYQFPYEVSRASRDAQIKMMIRRTSEDVPKWVKRIEKIIGKPFTLSEFQARDLLMTPYRIMANATWAGDKIIRSTSFYALKDMGYSDAEAAKVAGEAHGAYSELSESYKKIMSPITFVHSFRVLMPIEMARTVQEPVEGVIRSAFSKQGKKIPPKKDLSRWAKAIIGTLIIPVAIDLYMKVRGFEKTGVHLGPLAWKYKKTVTVNGKKSEIIVGINYILNMPIKWWQRLTYYNPIDPNNRFKQSLTNFLRWEVHPAWRIFFWDIIQNKPSFADIDYIYNPNEDWLTQTGQVAKYAFSQSFRFWGTLIDDLSEGERTQKEKEEQEKIFKEGLTGFDRALTYIFGYKYTRQNLPERQTIMKKWLDSEYSKRQFVIAKKYKGNERTKQLIELRKWRERCLEWIKEDYH